MPTVEPRRHELLVNGIRSPVLEAGPPDEREAVVFLHGNPGSSLDWEDLVARVGAFARAIAIDMPGFGRADKPRDFRYDVEGYARHLEAMLGALGVDRAHLVMHDFGGGWGLTWASRHPGATGSLTLIDIGILPGYRGHALAILWRLPVVGELVQLAATPGLMRALLRRGNRQGIPVHHVDRMIGDYDAGTKRAVLRLYRSISRRTMGRGLRDALRHFRGPVLVIWGAHDPYVPASYAERQRDVWPHAEVHVFEESGHWPMLDDPERTASRLLPFLRRHIAT